MQGCHLCQTSRQSISTPRRRGGSGRERNVCVFGMHDGPPRGRGRRPRRPRSEGRRGQQGRGCQEKRW